MATQGVTETPNDLTAQIDVATPIEMVRLLRQCDAQIFCGWKTWPSITDEEMISQLAEASTKLRAMFEETSDTLVVFSGAGTSGRLAFFCAQAFNSCMPQRVRTRFEYLIAGGDKALNEAQEQSEDSVDNGVRDLKKKLELQDWDDKSSDVPQGKYCRVLYVGISCGLSAPYVASQMEVMMKLEKAGLRYDCVVVGCNPLSLARSVPIPGWHSSFKDVASRIHPPHQLINPVVGPEAICGSSRMKGGSVTKMILETIFTLASRQAFLPEAPPITPLDVLSWYEITSRCTYEKPSKLAEIIQSAGESLSLGKRILYVSEDVHLSLLAVIDASECPPTFGALPTDVQAIFQHQQAIFPPSLRATPRPCAGDTLVVLTTGDGCELVQQWKGEASSVHVVSIGEGRVDMGERGLRICLPRRGTLPGLNNLTEMACKWILNAVSTGAHVLSGKILGNRMIDLKLSNHKLWDRAVGLVAEEARVGRDRACACLIRIVYQRDHDWTKLLQDPVAQHVSAAFAGKRVVPRAILLALREKTRPCTVAEVSEEIEAQPRLGLFFSELRQ